MPGNTGKKAWDILRQELEGDPIGQMFLDVYKNVRREMDDEAFARNASEPPSWMLTPEWARPAQIIRTSPE